MDYFPHVHTKYCLFALLQWKRSSFPCLRWRQTICIARGILSRYKSYYFFKALDHLAPTHLTCLTCHYPLSLMYQPQELLCGQHSRSLPMYRHMLCWLLPTRCFYSRSDFSSPEKSFQSTSSHLVPHLCFCSTPCVLCDGICQSTHVTEGLTWPLSRQQPRLSYLAGAPHSIC